MSDYGIFEASATDGHEEEQRQRQATRDLGTAIEAAREGFGDFLGSSTDKQDYSDRLALIMNDLMQKVADSGVMPVPGVMRKVKAALRPEFRKQAYNDGDAAEAAAAWAESLGYNDPWGFASWLVGKGYLHPMSDSEYQQHLQEFQAEDDPGVYGSRKQAASWKEVNPRSEGIHPDNAVWKIQGPNGLSGTVIDEFKMGTDSDWFIFGPSGLVLNRKFGEPPLTVDEAKKLVEDHINSGTLASRKQASAVDDLKSYVESKGVTTTQKDKGFTFPTADGAKGHVYENRAGEIVVQTLIGGSGGVQSNYTQDEVDLVKEWVDRTASIKTADSDTDARWFFQNLKGKGYTMPKDAGRPGDGGDFDDFLDAYANREGISADELRSFLTDNWDEYAYGHPKDLARERLLGGSRRAPVSASSKLSSASELAERAADDYEEDTGNDVFISPDFLSQYLPAWASANARNISYEELKAAAEMEGFGGHTASRKQASDIDLDDMGVLVFFDQFEDEGLEPSAPGDEQWEWLKHNVDYDILQDKIDLAYEHGEIGRGDADAMAYDLQQTFFGSRKQAFSDQLGVHLTEIFESGEAGGGWRPITGERLDWEKGDLEFYGGSGVFKDWSLGEDGDEEVLSFGTGDDADIIDAAWGAVDYANGNLASRKQADLSSTLSDENYDVSSFFWDTFGHHSGLDTDIPNTEQWDWIKENVSREEIVEGINDILALGGYITQADADALLGDLGITASRKTAGLEWDTEEENYWSYTSPDSGLDYWIKKDPADYNNYYGGFAWSVFDYLAGEGDRGNAQSFDEAEQSIENFIDSQSPNAALDYLGSRKTASDASYEGWTARIIYDEDDFEYAETTTPSGEQADSIYPMDGSHFKGGELREALEELAREWGDDAYSGTYQYNSRRKTALDIDGSWEEELPGIGYASCTPKAGGGFELYMWSDSKQSEALDVVGTSEEARRIWKEWRGSDTPPAGNAFNTDDNYFL